MKRIYLILLIIPLLGISQEKSFWSKANSNRINKSQLVDRNSTPSKSDIYNLDFEGLKNTLNTAVSRTDNSTSDIYVKFPNASGEMERYQIYNASIMEPEFAAQHSDIQSYVGVNIDKPGTTIRFSTTVFGFHAAIYTIGKTFYIDPYTSDLNTYTLYAKENLYSDIERLGCQISDEIQLNTQFNREASSSSQRNANDGTLRTFRLALACTQNYANFHINAAGQQSASDAVKRATVLAAMNVTMTRVNGIFERDLSLTMTLVDNSSILFIDEDDGYSDMPATVNPPFSPAATMINENVTIINNNIGSVNYDIGHLFSINGGGLASRGGICFNDFKAAGVTGGINPIGDPFDVDFVAHEMGHQYGANHTFNGGQSSCGDGNRSATTAIEPGSGTTIMAYAGICGNDNVQSNSNDYFHAISIDEIYSRITATGNYSGFPVCSNNTSNGNQPPTANAGQDFTIPFGTAFTLSGNGNDPDGGAVSFCWEQIDVGSTTDQPNTTSGTNPQFRSYSPISNPVRTFPQLSDILNDNLTPQWEVIPNVARTMDFALTVRDNQSPNGSQTNRDDMRVTLANTGPFTITSQITSVAYPVNASFDVTWNVAGTNANGINTSQVNILLSTNGGQTFDEILAANTPNDGSQQITLPNGITSDNCRIKIEAVGNIYFAINPASFVIGSNEVCIDYNFETGGIQVPENAGTYAGYILNIPNSQTISDLNINVNFSSINNADLFYAIRAPWQNSDLQQLASGICNNTSNTNLTFDDEGNAVNCATINNGDNVLPQVPLAFADGEDSSGDWVFFITDINVDGIFSTWNSTTISICYEVPNGVVLSDENFELDDFALFPNPNKGDFNLQFNSNSGKEIDVKVYDLSGKLIYNKGFDATSRFNEQIKLNNASTGIYIMKLNDSNKTVTRKLIID